MLRWEERKGLGGRAWWAYSGELVVGMVGSRDDGSVWYDASHAVSMRHLAKGRGEVKAIATAKRAVERAWSRWLEAAGLEQRH